MFLYKYLKNKLTQNITIITLLFLVSVLLRSPNIKETQYLGKGHEWITGHVLLTNSIWHKEGGANYYWAPVYTHNYKHDKTHPMFSHLVDKNGNRYYASYPPLVFYFPYIIFKLTGFEPNVVGLRSINLFIQFVSGFFIYLIVLSLSGKSIRQHIYWPAIVAFALYTFNTANLWINGNLYFSDMLAQPFFIAIVYFLVEVINNKDEKLSKANIVLLLVLSFFVVYSEWIGVFLLFTVFIVMLFYVRKNKSFFYLMFGMPIFGVLAIILTAYQYSLVDGWENFSKFIFEKYQQRSGATELAQGNFTITNPLAHDALKNYYSDGFISFFYLMAFVFIIVLIFILVKRKIKINKNIMSALLLSFIPVVLHIVLLFNFNSWHSFSIHKSSFPLVIIISSGLIFIHSEIEFLPKKNLRYLITSVLLSLVCFICYSGYKEYIKQVNPTYNYRINKVVGDAIQKYAKPEDVVFTDVSSCPELMFYSRRNSFNSSSIEESIEYMKGLNNAKDAIFIERYGQEIANIYRFNSSGEINLLWQRH